LAAVKLLITAFGAFPGMPSNPSARLVAQFGHLQRARFARLGIELVTAELPVVFAEVAQVLTALVEDVKPDAIIHTGVAGRRAVLSIETRAINRIGTLRTDAARQVSLCSVVDPTGAARLQARWPAARLVAAMRKAGARTAISMDAGDYVCNQTLYLSLLRTRVPVGFLHIPRPRARRKRGFNTGTSRPRLDHMIAALAQVTVILAGEVRRLA
jgi:pyroglutamyl-peptidase